MDRIDAAIKKTAENAKGSLSEVGLALGMREQTFINKVNEYDAVNELKVHELFALMLYAKDPSVIAVMADDLGYELIPKRVVTSKNLLDAVLQADAEQGDISRMVNDMVAKGNMSIVKLNEFQTEVHEAKDAIDAVFSSVKQLVGRANAARPV